MRMLKALGAVLVMIAIVFVAPAVLVRIGRLDALGSLQPTFASVPDLAVGVLTIVAWLAWVAACLSLVFEFVSALTAGQVRLSVPGLRVFSSSSALLVTALLGLGASAVNSVPEAPAIVQQADVSATNHAQEEAQRNDELLSYTTSAGDDLWTLAEEHLGDGMRWREIAELNDTVLGSPTQVLDAGTRLLIPHETHAVSLAYVQDAEESWSSEVEVEKGDSLWSIAGEQLGDPSKWPQILAANSDLIKDPALIKPGWRLSIPDAQQVDALESAEQNSTPVEEATPELPAEEVPDDLVALADVVPCPTRVEKSLSLESPRLDVANQLDVGPIVASVVSAVGSSAGVSLALAATLSAAIYRRRNRQQVQRPLGRAIRRPEHAAGELESAISTLGGLCNETARILSSHAHGLHVGHELTDDSKPISYDFFDAGITSISGDAERANAFATGIVLYVAASEEPDADIVSAGSGFDWLSTMDEPSLQTADAAVAYRMLMADLAGRSEASSPDSLRPRLYVFEQMPSNLPAAEDLRRCALGVLVCEASNEHPMFQVADATAKMPGGRVFSPELVSAPARRGLAEIFEKSSSTEYEQAEWWGRETTELAGQTERDQEAQVNNSNPILLMLGPVTLESARGKIPPRALKQCQEYCAWLLEHPGASAAQMTRSLLVAEGTRRSNMSRLRSWLGSDEEGNPYLPEAYSGRIRLHPGVSSDWEQFRTMLVGGVDRASETVLRRALELVRGAPLADAAPGQWSWAEPLRVAMASMIRDTGLRLGRLALEHGDIETARWAAAKGLLAVPEDELLLGLRLKTEHLAGNDVEADRLVLHITRHARQLGVDLLDETVELLQQTVEGQARARAI